MGSIASYLPVPLKADYQASKFAVRGMWKSVRGQEAVVGGDVNVNFIAPTFMNTKKAEVFRRVLEGKGV